MSITNQKHIIMKRPLNPDVDRGHNIGGRLPDGDSGRLTANQVCTNCKKRKKKCDKRLPCCSFCIRRHITCTYEDSGGKSSTLTELEQLRTRLEKVENSITVQLQVSDETNGSASSEESMTSWLDSLLEVRSWDVLIHQPTLSDIHSSVANKVRQIIAHCGTNITTSCATYFEHVHKWMPVISQELFYEALRDTETSPRADFSLLILCIHLMIQVPAGDAKVSQIQESLYLTTKCLYVCLQTLLPRSMTGLQAGLLIATFEHASGLCEEAYMTIGGCARGSSLMRLSRTPSRQVQKGTHAWLQAVEVKNLWWGILIRDRAINLEPQMRGLPLAVEDPSPIDELPTEADDWSTSTGQTLALGRSLDATTIDKLSVGSFGREAQACCLYNRVIKIFNNLSLAPLEREKFIQVLDGDIQKFLGLLMDQSSGTWGTFCGSTSLTLASLYALHEQQDNSINQHPEQKQQRSMWSELALEYVTRIVVDITDVFNSKFSSFNMTAISPGYTNIILRAAMQHIRSSKQVGSAQWLSDLESFRKALWFFKHRWKISESYLREIDSAARAVTSAPLIEYTGFVYPQGNRSGLC